MTKKMWSLLLTGALIAGVFTAVPAMAQAAPEVPATPNVVDPIGDANYLNDQGQQGTLGFQGDNVTPVDGGSVSDIMAAWFTADEANVYAHIQTEAPGPATAALFYRVTADPGVGANCLWFQAGAPGAGNAGSTGAALRTVAPCEPVQTVSEGAEFTQAEGPDGTGIHTIKIPRALSPYLVDGAKLGTPTAETRHYPNTPAAGATAPQIDNTKKGTDYTISSSGGAPTEPPVAQEPDGEPEPKPKSVNCKKKKNKKKKACKKGDKPVESGADKCGAYVPGELGAEAETTVVTEEATEEAPIVVEYTLGPAFGKVDPAYDLSTRVSHNVQLDSVGPEAGLFMRLETPETDDPDLYAYWNDGSEAAVAGGFNQALFAGPVPGPAGPVVNGSGNAGESGFGYEQINGLRTADCAGWDLDLVNWAGIGGTYTLKLWVGEIQNDPTPPAKAVE